MLICLYVLPKYLSRYKITTKNSFYVDDCLSNVASNLAIPYGNGTYNNGSPDATWYCNVMNNCGFPMNNTFASCPLYTVSCLRNCQNITASWMLSARLEKLQIHSSTKANSLKCTGLAELNVEAPPLMLPSYLWEFSLSLAQTIRVLRSLRTRLMLCVSTMRPISAHRAQWTITSIKPMNTCQNR